MWHIARQFRTVSQGTPSLSPSLAIFRTIKVPTVSILNISPLLDTDVDKNQKTNTFPSLKVELRAGWLSHRWLPQRYHGYACRTGGAEYVQIYPIALTSSSRDRRLSIRRGWKEMRTHNPQAYLSSRSTFNEIPLW